MAGYICTISHYNSMNQELPQIQQTQQTRQLRTLDKATFQLANKRIRQSLCKENKNIWIVARSTPKKLYVVRWNEKLDAFMRACNRHAPGSCIHFFAVNAYVFAGEKFESE